MTLVTTNEILRHAMEHGYGVCAFNVENMEMVQAVVDAAKETASPVIIQTSANTVKYAPMDMYMAMVSAAVKDADVPVALHLDHGDGAGLALKAIRAGYTSVMIDASKQPFEENLRMTAEIVGLAKPVGVSVEAELGNVGGKPGDPEYGTDGYTKVEQAVRFVEQSGVDSLAVAIGTAHGVYHGEPVLDLERLQELRDALDVPLVLHGASGLTEQDVRNCIRHGISKINYATELRIAFTEAVKEYIGMNEDFVDPKKFTGYARDRVKAVAIEKMKSCGSHSQATGW
ncbi:class II fructose-bisphosphate aldolase [Edaphobacillus lindanitolerans]|uniref:Tagatose 1,6-diphosphate aldolase GatY/KbaY n=1 Tax=Edaphobacillus lindanitolerans TaxID=550447 RepID=A0A1U7PID7_9BACI|nr:class II fructose-bisphosphate aldolase [Edaphobacillus lindanitolerans]SIT73200.1 tagatose 1,6-diphosphate aldolase GatY/KbaY [Edaphobacillus lindanitolerans]